MVVEHIFNFKLDESMQVSSETVGIQGELDYFFIQSTRPVMIKITYRNKNIQLFKIDQFMGEEIFPIRFPVYNSDIELLTNNNTSMYIFGSILIEISGSREAEVNITVGLREIREVTDNA